MESRLSASGPPAPGARRRPTARRLVGGHGLRIGDRLTIPFWRPVHELLAVLGATL